jgi:hypothetical protein
MHVEAVALVLRQNDDSSKTAVRQIGQGKVDEAVLTTMRDRWFRTVRRQGHETLPHAPSEYNGEDSRINTQAIHDPILADRERKNPDKVSAASRL